MNNMDHSSKKSQNCKLSCQVLEKLDQDYLSEPLRNELKQVNGYLAEAMEENFKYQIVLGSVISFQDKKLNTEVEKTEKDILSDPLYLNLVKKYLPPSSADGIELFGVNADLVDEVRSRKKKSQLEKEELNKFVEKDIDEFCDKISEYIGYADRYRSNKRRAFQESVKDLSSEISCLAVNNAKIASDKAEINELLLTYHKNLEQGISTFKKLVHLYKKKLEFEFLLESSYLTKRDTLSAKISYFEYQILNATYSKKSIDALEKIRQEVDTKKTRFDYEISKTNTELQAYCVLGPTYESLVDQYSGLCKDIQHQMWTNEALKRKKSCSESVSHQDVIKEKTVNFSDSEKEVDCSMQEEKKDNSDSEETIDNSQLEETVDSSVLEEKMNDSDSEETINNAVLEETVLSCMVEETLDGSQLEETMDCSKLDETGIDNVLDETMGGYKPNETCSSKLEETFNSSELDENMHS